MFPPLLSAAIKVIIMNTMNKIWNNIFIYFFIKVLLLKKFFNKRVHFIHCKYLSLLIYSSIFEIEYRLLISSIRERRKARYGGRKQLHFRHGEYYRFMPVWKRKESAKNGLFSWWNYCVFEASYRLRLKVTTLHWYMEKQSVSFVQSRL